MKTEVPVNPAILSWAITRAGVAADEMTKAFPKLPYWLRAEGAPTLRQLEDFSKKVHLPFGFLLLDEPPVEQLPFPHFRTGLGRQDAVSVNLYDTILAIQERQQWLVDYLEEAGIAEPLPFVGRFGLDAAPEAIVADIRATLQLENPMWAAAFSKTEDAIGYLVEKIEEAGIYTVFNGCVENNTHRPLDVEECRGFVMVHPLAPFLFVNNADGKAAQLFTLMHELAHVWLGASAGFDNNKLIPASDPLELLCDQVAAELLVPAQSFATAWEKASGDIERTAKLFKASNVVIARRALDFGKLTRSQFFHWYNIYKGMLAQRKAATGGGGDFYNTSKRRVGLRFVALVDRAIQERRLSYREAYRLTGLKGDTYQTFITKNLR